MKVRNFQEVEPEAYIEGAKGVTFRVMIGEREGAPNYVMRHFHIDPGGYTPYHSHPWEHEIFIIEGEGVIKVKGEERVLRPGDSVFIPPDEEHQFIASETKDLNLICVIPRV